MLFRSEIILGEINSGQQDILNHGTGLELLSCMDESGNVPSYIFTSNKIELGYNYSYYYRYATLDDDMEYRGYVFWHDDNGYFVYLDEEGKERWYLYSYESENYVYIPIDPIEYEISLQDFKPDGLNNLLFLIVEEPKEIYDLFYEHLNSLKIIKESDLEDTTLQVATIDSDL